MQKTIHEIGSDDILIKPDERGWSKFRCQNPKCLNPVLFMFKMKPTGGISCKCKRCKQVWLILPK